MQYKIEVWAKPEKATGFRKVGEMIANYLRDFRKVGMMIEQGFMLHDPRPTEFKVEIRKV